MLRYSTDNWASRFLGGALCSAALFGCSAADDPTAAGGSGVNNGGSMRDDRDDNGAILGEDSVDIPVNCGDGILADAEYCDDGNNTAGDGCAPDCNVELGFVCPQANAPCEFSNYCGDGRVTPPELCDDANQAAGDGCDLTCNVEVDWACPSPGQPCVPTAECGDGIKASLEQCDDGNTNPGDGCSATCAAEPGFLCGDGVIAGIEDCEDGNTLPGDGCSADCLLEPPRWDPTTSSMIGFVCDVPGQPCRPSVCGDGVVEGGEPCDDGNNGDMGDGCSPGCRLEPDCSAADGTCVSSCGDGLILPGDDEQCDDGNSKPGDGCDANCLIEPGFDCPVVSEAGAVDLPIVYRDFMGVGWMGGYYNANGHPDFENEQFSRNTPKVSVTSTAGMTFGDIAGPTQGMVNAQLGAGQTGPAALKPVWASSGAPAQINSAATFAQWYTDVVGTNMTLVSNLTLIAGGANTFEFDTTAFYPIDGQGFVATGMEQARAVDWLGQGCGARQPDGQWTQLAGGSHNYSFTSEVRYWFEYQGGEQLVFRGDDDVWVFIKRQLVVDLGGNHEPFGGDVCGNTFSTIEAAPDCAGLGAATTDVAGNPLNLQVGRVYEVAVFQAERHTCQSNYRLTISNFARRRSECTPICGDGVIAGTELCDDGEMNGAGYGFCAADCTRGPRCGDAIIDAAEGELCDNGPNLDQYYLTETSCGPNCQFPGYCGDGIVHAAFAEECDLGTVGNIGAYGGCTSNCERGPRCGDGILSEADGEVCDDGNLTPNDGCSQNCTFERPIGAR